MWFLNLDTDKAKAVKTKWFAPYQEARAGKVKTNLAFLKEQGHRSGVYFIRSNRTGEIIYVGYSASQLYVTILHHFTEWNDKKSERFTYSKTGYEIRVILTTPTRAALLEKYLIAKMKPRDNQMKYDSYLSDTQTARAKEIHEAAPEVDIDDDIVPF